MLRATNYIMLTIFLTITSAWATIPMETIAKLKNTKEVFISSFSKNEQKRIKEKFQDQNQNTKIKNILYSTIQNYLDQEDAQCELRFIAQLSKNLKESGINVSLENLQDTFKMLRVTNAIDDIFYDILIGLSTDQEEFGELKLNKRRSKTGLKPKKLLEKNDVAELFSGFSVWPDESDRCVYQEFIYIKNKIKNKHNIASDKKRHFKLLLKEAYRQNIFNLETYNKLEYLRTKSFVTKRNFWLRDYFKIIFNAKDKMKPINSNYVVRNIEEEDSFTSERIRRFSRMTRRKVLFKKYDETQIILLSQIIQRASKRMGADPDTKSGRPVISQEFSTINENGERENYVEQIELDPQSQFNLARRLLRKEMVETQMMETFVGLQITYEDLVTAAFETGYITFEDLEYVVKYDDLWNPTTTPFEKIVGFSFNVAGVGSIFLPPPWNITATIALGVVEGLILNTRKNGAENDNPATFIE